VGVQTDKPPTHYLTMWEVARFADVQTGSLSRWVKQWRLDTLTQTAPERGEGGSRQGYSIPAAYALVAQGWKLTQDKRIRQVMLRELPKNPVPWLVVVADQGVTCYSGEQASQEVAKILVGKQSGIPEQVSVFYLGEIPNPSESR